MPITEEGIRARLHTAVFGHPLTVRPQLPSTNAALRTLAEDGAPEGTALLAVRQTAGRGRRGRAFHSPAGGIYLSVLLRPQPGTDTGRITSCAAVAVARAIERLCPLRVQIKWVNDLFVGGRKVCGILAEGGIDPANGALRYVVLGIGIDVAAQSFPPPLDAVATTLENEGAAVEPDALAAAVLEEWERAYAAIGDGAWLDESRRRSLILGRTVTVERGSERFCGTADAIDGEGHLHVITPDGRTAVLSSGEVSIRL